jgi:hypothetical protein
MNLQHEEHEGHEERLLFFVALRATLLPRVRGAIEQLLASFVSFVFLVSFVFK